MEISRPLVSQKAIGCAMTVHRALGPGLLESAYSSCLARQFTLDGVVFDREVSIPVVYRGVPIDCGYRVDFLVEGTLVLELKAVDKLLPVHSAQVATYMRLLPAEYGLLINFNVSVLRHGLKRVLL